MKRNDNYDRKPWWLLKCLELNEDEAIDTIKKLGKGCFEQHGNLPILKDYVGSNYVHAGYAKGIVNRVIIEYFTNELSFDSFMFCLDNSILMDSITPREEDIIFLLNCISKEKLNKKKLIKQLRGERYWYMGNLYDWNYRLIAASLLWEYFRDDLDMGHIIRIGGSYAKLQPKIEELISEGAFQDRHLSKKDADSFTKALWWQRDATFMFLDKLKQ